MIHEALDYIRRELRDRLTFEDASVMIDSASAISSQSHTKGTYISLVNIGNDPALRNQSEPAGQRPRGLNIHLLFCFDFETYHKSLAQLANTIAVFEEKPVYDAATASGTNPFPDSLESLKFTLYDTDFAALNNLWSLIGSAYLPSVVYEVQVTQAQARE